MTDVLAYIAAHSWVPVTLTEAERAFTDRIGELRYQRCRELGLQSRTYGKEALADPALNDRNGAAAEFAVAKYLGARWTGLLDTPDDGADLERFGKRFDVKSAYPGRPLIANGLGELRADYLVLVYRMTPRIQAIAGMVSRSRFLMDAGTHDFGYGLRLMLPLVQLDPPEYLLLVER